MSSACLRTPALLLTLLGVTAVLSACSTPTASETGRSESPTAANPASSAPTAAATPATPDDRAAALVADMSLRDRVSSLLVLHVAGTDPAVVHAFVDETHPGGLILMGDNVAGSVAEVAELAAAVQDPDGPPLLLGIDQEGGVVRRLPGDDGPAGAALHGATDADVTAAFTTRATIVHDAGLNLNFGVVADVTADPGSFIFDRTLGADPATAAAHVAAAVRGESAAGVLSTLKHFPGHGAAPGDSHSSLPRTDRSRAEWEAVDAVPFRAGIDAGAEFVMFGHLVYSAVDSRPASVSPVWHDILRDDLGFTGVSITDDMGMLENSGDPAYGDRVTNGVAALNAGMTMLLYVADGPTPVTPTQLIDGLTTAVEDGRIPETTIDAAATVALTERLTLAR
ncbi:glycoside hydrolase family 3 N-terminal domain-containing protein [Microbacterium gorillae]|uniref:glycoside hydrolase family 3 N-terminal domain-containing protein n=1 Tax=Microbacterium gorillae TaxID=1231063 RepID=UPI0005913C03|nr:glycoside hydrolase family 3 N-terminal domain-containing protein [Microbacterium gorillae]